MPLDLSGFRRPVQDYQGLYEAANQVRQQRNREIQLGLEMQGRQAATSKFLADYLDPKDHLTGTNYDPQIVQGYGDVLQQAQALASKGASTSDILMAIGPSVNRLSQYSTTAKTVNQNIQNSLAKLKAYPGYNQDALLQEAKKQAFLGPDGKLKDISSIDPNQDYVAMAVHANPEAVTSGKALDDFVQKTPMADYTGGGQTEYGGRTRIVKYETKHPFWEDLQRDANGNILTNMSGNPVGLAVKGTPMTDDSGKPIMNPQTNQPFMAMDKNNFNAIMTHNPDIADYIRGEVNTNFKNAGAKQIPAEGSPQWDMMARHILHDELQTRSKSSFKPVDTQRESAQAIKIDIAQHPDQLQGIAEFNAAQRGSGDYSAYNPKNNKTIKTNAIDAAANIWNNNPDYLGGDHTTIKDPNGEQRDVIDVTPYFPGGGLKSGRGATGNYESIYYDPNKRSMLLEVKGKTKDADGNYPTSYEEVPESQAGRFMTRIAAANNVDPSKVGDILNKYQYRNARFMNPIQSNTGAQLSQEHEARVNTALQKEDYDSIKGIQTPDGIVQNVDKRTYTSWLPGRNKYAVNIKTPSGETTTKYFNDKDALDAYLKSSNSSTPKAILD